MLYFTYCLYCFFNFFKRLFLIVSPYLSLLRSGRNGAQSCQIWNKSIHLVDCPNQRAKVFKVFRFQFICYCLIFSSIGLIPLCDSVKPNHLVCTCANLHFSNLSRNLASSSVFNTSSTFFMCCSWLPFVTIRMSLMNAKVFRVLCQKVSMIFCNSCGVYVNPHKPLLNACVPVFLSPFHYLSENFIGLLCQSSVWPYAYSISHDVNITVPSSLVLIISATCSFRVIQIGHLILLPLDGIVQGSGF